MVWSLAFMSRHYTNNSVSMSQAVLWLWLSQKHTLEQIMDATWRTCKVNCLSCQLTCPGSRSSLSNCKNMPRFISCVRRQIRFLRIGVEQASSLSLHMFDTDAIPCRITCHWSTFEHIWICLDRPLSSKSRPAVVRRRRRSSRTLCGKLFNLCFLQSYSVTCKEQAAGKAAALALHRQWQINVPGSPLYKSSTTLQTVKLDQLCGTAHMRSGCWEDCWRDRMSNNISSTDRSMVQVKKKECRQRINSLIENHIVQSKMTTIYSTYILYIYMGYEDMIPVSVLVSNINVFTIILNIYTWSMRI